jgi:hypothetical protein
MAGSQNCCIILIDSLQRRIREVGPTVHASTWITYGETWHPHEAVFLDLLKEHPVAWYTVVMDFPNNPIRDIRFLKIKLCEALLLCCTGVCYRPLYILLNCGKLWRLPALISVRVSWTNIIFTWQKDYIFTLLGEDRQGDLILRQNIAQVIQHSFIISNCQRVRPIVGMRVM